MTIHEKTLERQMPCVPHIARKMLNLFLRHVPAPETAYDLTARERGVPELMVAGHDFQGIADRLVISFYTVRAHVRNLYDKLHVHSKSQAVAKALREHLI